MSIKELNEKFEEEKTEIKCRSGKLKGFNNVR